MNCKRCQKPLSRVNVIGYCRVCQNIVHKKTLGAKLSARHCKAISFAKLGSKNPNWKGNKVRLKALHLWVTSRLPKPKFCQDCKIVPPYDLANRGKYDRDLGNWEWLCRRCHMTKDGRLEILVKRNRGET